MSEAGLKKEEEAHMLHDLGNLMMVDTHSFDGLNDSEVLSKANKNFEGMLKALIALKDKSEAKDFDSPILEVALPPKMLEFPRQKPIPKPKPLTKWEKFRVNKGLRPHQKKPRLVYDEITKSWVPRFGFKSKKHIEDAATGIVEDSTGVPLSERDPFDERVRQKKLRVQKQKLREVKNKLAIAKSEKAKEEIGEALKIAQRSTASMGKFDKRAKSEKPPKPQKEKIDASKWNVKDEKKRGLEILSVIGKREATETSKAPNLKGERKGKRDRKDKKDRKGRKKVKQ